MLVISSIFYLLADRYLIEHIEISNVNALAVVAERQATPQEITLVVSNTTSLTPKTAPLFDDWNYVSDTLSINVRQVTTGSKKNTVTYFIADVILTDAIQLRNAFAKNMFGNNIIEYTSQIAADNNAIFAINSDYYGFRSDGSKSATE